MSDFFTEHGTEIFAAINFIAVTFLVPLLKQWLDEHLTQKRSQRVQTAILSGLNQAINAATSGKNFKDTATAVINDHDVRSTVVDLATDYVRETVPKAVDKLKIDDALKQVIDARVEEAITALAKQATTINTAVSQSETISINTGGPAPM